jgi:polyhydroxybutyrate depolymerase
MKRPGHTERGDAQPSGMEPAITRMSVSVDGMERRYGIHVPQGWDGRTALPAVTIFHGGGGTAANMIRMTRWTDKADEAGFLAAFLEGMSLDPARPGGFADNPQFWNDGTGRQHVGERDINDVGFVDVCIDDLASRFPIDERQIFAVGFSNGAFMVSRLAIELSHKLAAIGAVAGLYLNEHARPSPAVSVLCIMGTEDPLSPLHGGEVTWPWGGKEVQPSVFDSARKWAQLAGCNTHPRIVEHDDGIRAISYSPQEGEAEVLLYTIEGMGHTWPGTRISLPEHVFGKSSHKLQACDTIWEFFQQHKRNGDARGGIL